MLPLVQGQEARGCGCGSLLSQPAPSQESLLLLRWWRSDLPELVFVGLLVGGVGGQPKAGVRTSPRRTPKLTREPRGSGQSPTPQPGPGVAWQSQAVSGGGQSGVRAAGELGERAGLVPEPTGVGAWVSRAELQARAGPQNS